MIEEFFNGRLVVRSGDITKENVDAIVNAANRTLLGGGGVDRAIHEKAGPSLLEECREIRKTKYPDGLPTGRAVITKAGNLPARHVIHTVGPIYGSENGHEQELLADCYRNSFSVADENGLTSLAFPSISTGAYGYPKHLADRIASAAVLESLHRHDRVTKVHLVFFSEPDAELFLRHKSF